MTVQALLTPVVDSTVVLSAKVNCMPWVTVHFCTGSLVFLVLESVKPYIHLANTVDNFILNFSLTHDQVNLEITNNYNCLNIY